MDVHEHMRRICKFAHWTMGARSAQTRPGLNGPQGQFCSRSLHCCSITMVTYRLLFTRIATRIIRSKPFRKFHRFCLLVFAKVYSSANSFPSSNRLACVRSGGVEEDKRMPWAKRHRELQLNEVTFPPTHKSSHAPRKRRKTIVIMNVKCPRIMR